MGLRRVYSYKIDIQNYRVAWPEYLDRLHEKITTDTFFHGELDSILVHEPGDTTSVVEFHIHPNHNDERSRRDLREMLERYITELEREIDVKDELDSVLNKVRRLRTKRVLEELQKDLGIGT